MKINTERTWSATLVDRPGHEAVRSRVNVNSGVFEIFHAHTGEGFQYEATTTDGVREFLRNLREFADHVEQELEAVN